MRKAISAGSKGVNPRRIDFNATISGRPGINLDVTRREPISRRSVFPFPSSTSDDSLNDEELGEIDTQYNDYLVSHAVNINRLVRNREKVITTQMASLSTMKEGTESKLVNYQRRNHDIQDLEKINATARKGLYELDDILHSNENRVTETLQNIYANLQNFNSLEVNNFIIPEKLDELQALKDNLDRCRDALEFIIDSFAKSKLEMSIYDNIANYKKAVELTSSLLKSTSEKNNQELQYKSLKLLMKLLKKIFEETSSYRNQSVD